MTDHGEAQRRALRERAARLADDPRFDALRPLPRRRALVVAALGAVAGLAVTLWFGGPAWVAVPLWLAAAAGLVLLRRVVREAADFPDEALDERLIGVRDSAYRTAFATVAALCIAVLVPLWIAVDGFDYTVTAGNLHALVWGVILTTLTLPSAILAWTERDL